jgi:diguanylate cyclase (GGDEF)-like protein
MCLGLEYMAVCALKRRPAPAAWVSLPSILTFAVCAWFAFVERNITIQLILVNAISLAMLLLIAGTLWRAEEGRRTFVDTLAAMAYTAMGVVTGAVAFDDMRRGRFSVEYNFNSSRTLIDNAAAIVIEGVVFPLFILMVSERLNRDLVVKAMRDPLTDLYNRRAFEDIAFRELSGATRTGLGVSLLVFDIDHLKEINDAHGHAAGDAVLVAAAAAMRRSLRDEDFLCRWGGDEFCALLPRAGREQAQVVMERVQKSFADLGFKYEDEAIPITVSTGMAADEGHAQEFSSLLRLADTALYRAKQAGRNRFVIASGESPA